MAYGNIAVGTSATVILVANPKRTMFQLYHDGTSAAIYHGENSSVTTANGYTLAQTGEYKDETTIGRKCYQGAVYGIVASSTEDLRYIERE
jgi:hypothetical protein